MEEILKDKNSTFTPPSSPQKLVSKEILRTPLSHLNVCVQFPVLSTL